MESLTGAEIEGLIGTRVADDVLRVRIVMDGRTHEYVRLAQAPRVWLRADAAEDIVLELALRMPEATKRILERVVEAARGGDEWVSGHDLEVRIGAIVMRTPGVPPDAEAMGYAWSDRCTIWVNTRGLAPLSICYVTVHELGHLAGRAHEDGHGVMAPVVTDIDWAPCKRLMRGFRSTEGPWLFG
jgi:hypothetical protein